MPKRLTREENAARIVAETYYLDDGKWMSDAFEIINSLYFKDELPYPNLRIEITPHAKRLGHCSSAKNRPPIVNLHPTMFGIREKEYPWGIPDDWLGRRYAFDVLLHECIHASVTYRLNGWGYGGQFSHNNDFWVAEVNRIAPMLGFHGLVMGKQISKRMKVDGKYTADGKPMSKVCKVSTGNVPYKATPHFPHWQREYFGTAKEYYTSKENPPQMQKEYEYAVT